AAGRRGRSGPGRGGASMTTLEDDPRDLAAVDPGDVPFLRTPAPLDLPTSTSPGRATAGANPWTAVAPASSNGSGSAFGMPAPDPEGVIHLGPPVDWALVQSLRVRVSERLSHVVSTASPAMS